MRRVTVPARDWKLRVLRWCAMHTTRIVPIVVYQMAKVGSSAVVEALQRAGLPVFHIHRMNAEHLTRMQERRRALDWDPWEPSASDRLGLRMRRKVMDHDRRVAIVSFVRDPVARNISSYFEWLHLVWRGEDVLERVPLDRLLDGFHERFPHDEALTWFDDEMLPVTGIDVYSAPFPPSGHVVFEREKKRLLILKAELSDAGKSEALSSFLGRGALTIAPVNQTAGKATGAAYQRFQKELRLDRNYLSRMLDSRYARHFYTPEERDGLWRKYTRG